MRVNATDEIIQAKKWYEYTILSASQMPLEINAAEATIKGDIHTNGNFNFSGSKLSIEGACEASGKINASGAKFGIANKLSNVENVKVPDIISEIKENIKDDAYIIENNKQFNSKEVKIDKPTIVEGELRFNGSELFLKSYIVADKDININVAKVNQNTIDKLVLCSSNGNININASNANINGIIYAPKGTVTINTAKFTLNGRIIANKVVYRGSSINIKSSEEDLNLIGGLRILQDDDNDEIPDAYEGEILVSAMMENGIGLHDPQPNEDYDSDGLTNIEEYKLGINPGEIDTDEDGLTDYEEINIYTTNPNIYDTDADEMGDGTEVTNNLNPVLKDTDKDETIDSEEVFEQTLISSKYKDLDITKSLVTPRVTIIGKGDYSKQINIKDVAINETFNAIKSIVGHPFEIEHEDDLRFESSKLTFRISEIVLQTHDISNLKVAYYDLENNKIEILESTVDAINSTVTAVVNHFSCYFVIDEEDYYYDINVLNENSKINTGKVDVVFTIDTTGSMLYAMGNVKYNINYVVDQLQVDNIDVRFGLVSYKDLEIDGLYSTKDYGWFDNENDFKAALKSLYASGGGDIRDAIVAPSGFAFDSRESAIDGLDVSRRKRFRSDANKHIILITDAGYKNGIAFNSDITMNEEVDLLKESNIKVSVITGKASKSYYEALYTETNGIVADIYGSFFEILRPLIAGMDDIPNDGAWIRLSNGSIVHLDKDPGEKDYSIDSDNDGIPDLLELSEEVKVTYFDWLSHTMRTYRYWTFMSNPTLKDTDGDGKFDNDDIEPSVYDIYIKEQTDDYVLFNNGKKWLIFGTDIYAFRDNVESTTMRLKSELDAEQFEKSEMYKRLMRLIKNRETNLVMEEIVQLVPVDINGIRDYLTIKNKDIVNEVFEILTGRKPHYYKHSLFRGWVDKGETPIEEDWTDFFTGDVKNEAEATLTIYYSLDLAKIIKGVLFAGIVIGASYLAVGEITLLVEGFSTYGVMNTLTMYSCGGSSMLQTMLEDWKADGDSDIIDILTYADDIVQNKENVWVEGDVIRGQKVDEILGNNLGRYYPVADHLDNRLLTSFKSIDTAAPTYSLKGKLYNKIIKDIKSLNKFTGRTYAGVTVTPDMYDEKMLKLVIPYNNLNGLQARQIDAAKEYAKQLGIDFNITILTN
jgi:hypothetical protein